MIERKGINKHADLEIPYDIFGERTQFRLICTALVEKIVQGGKWFSFCTKIKDSQVDIMTLQGSPNKPKLGSMVADVFSETVYRTAIYKYLLSEFLCYYESPSIARSSEGSTGFKQSFNKCLVTSNICVIAEWLGISLQDATVKYGSRLFLSDCDLDEGSCSFPYLKLYTDKNGVRKVTVPRKDLDLSESGVRITPLFALHRGISVLYDKLRQGSYNVSFVKDSGHERVINCTFNKELIEGIYLKHSGRGFLDDAFSSWYGGDLLQSAYLERGFIKVFELGSSIYDEPLRGLSYSRITSIEEASPDLSYIMIDLDSVITEFKKCIYSLDSSILPQFIESMKLFSVADDYLLSGKELKSFHGVELWADNKYILLGTVFLRNLSLFMLGNPQWFNGYTGSPSIPVVDNSAGMSYFNSFSSGGLDSLDFSS